MLGGGASLQFGDLEIAGADVKAQANYCQIQLSSRVRNLKDPRHCIQKDALEIRSHPVSGRR